MATLEGAKALGLDKHIGSLLPGKLADVIAVELDDWNYQPCFDPASHLVYVAGREAVSHVWVGGKMRIEDKKPLELDISALRKETNIWQNAMQSLGSLSA
jgi:5-methylthioadenosine/S-adenosylhomocysteine deaminase